MNVINKEIIATLRNVCVVQGKVKGWLYDTCAKVHVVGFLMEIKHTYTVEKLKI